MTDTVNIKVVVDNHSENGFMTEHGLSLWIDTGSKRIVFDTGQGAAFDKNIQMMGIDLAQTDFLVLSHGHYDHTGGIPVVLKRAQKLRVACHPGVVHPRYAIRNGISNAIQMPRESMLAIDKLLLKQLVWAQQSSMLFDRVGITGPIPRETSYEDTGGPFYLDPAGKFVDPIVDDLAMWIQTDEGLVICVGCAHSGLVNTLKYIRHINDGSNVRAVIGGFHLLNASDYRLEQTINALRFLKPDSIIPCHCTGDKAVALLQKELGDRVTPGMAGMTFQF